ncbi:MAG TPA: hypothetical protein VJW76_16955 [Verrucomicrobiae bacterium]|nr:hypothetical protein [Verrucomicrobiae bacterium]
MIGAYITFAVAVGIVLTYVAVLHHFLGDADKDLPEAQVRTPRTASHSNLEEALVIR